MARQVALHRLLQQRLMQTPRQVTLSELPEGAREGRLARHSPRLLAGTQPAQRRLVPQPLHQPLR